MTATATATEAPFEPVTTTSEVWVHTRDLTRVLTNTVMFASDDASLPVISAVQVQVTGALPDGVAEAGQSGQIKCTATDRHTLAVDTTRCDLPSADITFILAARDVKSLLKALPKNTKVKVTVASTTVAAPYGRPEVTVTVDLHGSVVTYTGVDGDYPKAEALFPAESQFAAVEQIGLNPTLLTRFTKVDPGNGQKKGFTTSVIRFQGANKPALVTMGDTFRGLLMPVRLAS